jgi:hypothetical protein
MLETNWTGAPIMDCEAATVSPVNCSAFVVDDLSVIENPMKTINIMMPNKMMSILFLFKSLFTEPLLQ